jgi:general secretion pathway protein E
VALHELLLMSEGIKHKVLTKGAALAQDDGTYVAGNLLQDGATKVLQGMTTAEEVLRVARQND